jgi:hypothetical protein
VIGDSKTCGKPGCGRPGKVLFSEPLADPGWLFSRVEYAACPEHESELVRSMDEPVLRVEIAADGTGRAKNGKGGD